MDKKLFSLKKIGYHLRVFCEKYNLIIIWSNDVDCCLSFYFSWYCITNKIKVLIINQDSGKFLGEAIENFNDVEEKIKDENFINFLKNHYKTIKITLPFNREVLTVSKVNFTLKK